MYSEHVVLVCAASDFYFNIYSLLERGIHPNPLEPPPAYAPEQNSILIAAHRQGHQFESQPCSLHLRGCVLYYMLTKCVCVKPAPPPHPHTHVHSSLRNVPLCQSIMTG